MTMIRRIGTAVVLTSLFLPLTSTPALALSSGNLSSASFLSSAFFTPEATGYQGYFDLENASWAEDIDERLTAAPLGGLSGIEHVEGDRYLAISDDPAQRGPARVYDLNITLDARGTATAVTVMDIIELTDAEGQPFTELAVDPEAIRVLPNGNFLWTSEGYARDGDFRAPRVYVANPEGRVIDEMTVPAHHAPDEQLTTGIRHNNANEGLALSADGKTAYTLNEGALRQDGPSNTEDAGMVVRLTAFDVATGAPTAEYAVEVNPLYPGANDRGMAELIAVDDGSFIALERGFIPGEGNRGELYRITLDGATNILDIPALAGAAAPVDPVTPATKELLFDFSDNAEHPENIEGLAWGPELADGRRALLVVSDDNFNETQRSLLHTVALDLR